MLLAVAVLTPALLCAAQEKNETLDLKAELSFDPSVKRGKLLNGMSYWIRKHNRPEGKIGMYLHIDSGSLNEDDDQRGLAHFLEHMAFNGSKNFPAGTLIKYFESIGLRFGQHQNAFTSFDQTTYTLNLPDTKPETIEKGLQFLSDVGFRMSLQDDEIEKERGVILEESRARKGANQRILDKLLPVLMPGSRLAERMPIGKDEIISKAPPQRLRDYCQKWYRPDHTTLMIVGEIEPEVVELQIKKQFEDWKPAKDPAPACSPGVLPYDELRAAVFTDPELTETEVSAVNVMPLRKENTVGEFRERLVDGIGTWILNRRLSEMVQKGAAPFQSASTGISTFLNSCTYVNAEATGKPDQWEPMLRVLLLEVKRARAHGFLDQEFEDARKETLEDARQAAKQEGTLNATAFLGRMNNALAAQRKPQSAAQRLELLEKLLPGVALAEVHAAFKKSFAPNTCLLLVTMPEKMDLPVPKKEALLKVAADVEVAQVEALAAKKRASSLLEKEPVPGKIAQQEEDADLKILSVTFENGVRVHLRQMDFKKEQVSAQITIAGGMLQETADTKGHTLTASRALAQPASKTLDSTAIRDLLTGKQVGVGGGPDEDSFNLSVSGAPQDFEEGLRLAHLLLTQPKVEEPAVNVLKQQLAQMLASMKTSVESQLHLRLQESLAGGDQRHKMLTPEQVAALDAAKSQPFLEKAFAEGYIEVSFVGDMDRSKMLELAAKYLGSLPKRSASVSSLDELRKLNLPKGPLEEVIEVQTITPRGIAAIGWRGADWKNVKDRRLLDMAGRILAGRVREEIREKRSLAYSPSAGSTPGQVYPGLGRLATSFQADPDKIHEAVKLARELTEALAKDGPTDEEMTTVRKQLKNALEETLKEPSYWSGVLSDLDYRGTKLSDVKDVVKMMSETYTKEDIQECLKRYVVEERRFQFIALPKGDGKKPEAVK